MLSCFLNVRKLAIIPFAIENSNDLPFYVIVRARFFEIKKLVFLKNAAPDLANNSAPQDVTMGGHVCVATPFRRIPNYSKLRRATPALRATSTRYTTRSYYTNTYFTLLRANTYYKNTD